VESFGETFNVLVHSSRCAFLSFFLTSYEFLLQRLICFKKLSELEGPVEARSAFTAIVFRQPLTQLCL
jgi:hypothetical protein